MIIYTPYVSNNIVLHNNFHKITSLESIMIPPYLIALVCLIRCYGEKKD